MKSLRIVAAVVLATGLIGLLRAEQQTAGNKTLIVGAWELTKADYGGPPIGTDVEFAKDGKMKMTGKADGKESVADGTYVVEGNKLTVILKTPDREEMGTVTIKKLTDRELATEDEVGRVVEFTRKPNKEPGQKSGADEKLKDAALSGDAAKIAVDEKTIQSLIVDLGHESFDKRETAHKRLLGIGGPALDLLKKAAKDSTDAEVRARSNQLVEKIEEIQETQLFTFRAEFYKDFRGKVLPNKSMRFVGPATMIKSEAEGLHVTLPADQNVGAVGVALEYKVKGDFEITAGYEILLPAQPQAGLRAGFELYLTTETANREALAFDRGVRVDGQDIYACSRMTTSDGKRVNTYKGADVPAAGKFGQLRIVRIGSKVVLSVQEDPAKEFRVVHRADLGKEDIKQIRLAANAGGAATVVELRIRDIRVRAAEADTIKPIGLGKSTPAK